MNCKSRAFINEDKLQVSTVLSCSSRKTDFEVLLAKSTMKKKAETTSEDLHLIFQNTLSEFPAVVSESVSFRQIIQSLQKGKRLNEPSNPKSPNEAGKVLNDKECHHYGDIFLGSVEQGLQNALKITWSESLVNVCRFHFENAITKQLAILGLQREYRHQIQVKKWARKVSALCLLPANKIMVAWGSRVIEIAQFSREIKIKLLAFKRYFESYWLNIVIPEGFSVYGLNHKTNNNAESLNRRLKSNMVTDIDDFGSL
nr:uncharacterized protein LOC124818983 [Hydra vulgaris]